MVSVPVHSGLSSSYIPAKAREVLADTAPKLLGMRGLIRKCFLLSDDGASAASVYLWERHSPAGSFFTEVCKHFMAGKYGHRPNVTCIECPAVGENLAGEIIKGGLGEETAPGPGRTADAA